jgi:uncharacterized membrane protein
MTGFQYGLIMFTLMIILARVADVEERSMWQLLQGLWFIAMVISVVRELMNAKNKLPSNSDK